jgi:hypothetical protein
METGFEEDSRFSPALREMLAELRARRENIAIVAKLAAPDSVRSAYAAAVARSKLKPHLTIVSDNGEQHE